MSEIITWAEIAKGINDPTTIEDYVEAMFDTHNASDNSHGQSSEAIYNHRIADILDHIDQSITADKYADFSLSYEKLRMTKTAYILNLESVDSWNLAGNSTLEDCYLLAGAYSLAVVGASGKYTQFTFDSGATLVQFGTKNPIVEASISFQNITSQTLYFGTNWPFATLEFVGFKIVDATINACWRKNSTEYLEAIGTITAEQFVRLRARVTSGVSIEFYINDILEHTATTNLPTNESGLRYIIFYLTKSTADERSILIQSPSFIQDL